MDDEKKKFEDMFLESLKDVDIENIINDKEDKFSDINEDFSEKLISLESLIESDYPEMYKGDGVQNRLFDELKRMNTLKKKYNTIDLHNCESTLEGLNVLNSFFRNNASKYRYFKIIHGKGLHNKDRSSPMRTMVRKFLINTNIVLAYTRAEGSDGADGATYVLVKQ